MNEQQIREAILDVIDAGDPDQPLNRDWKFYEQLAYLTEGGTRISITEQFASDERLRFCDAVIAKLTTPSMSPEEAARVETVTIGESVRYGHLEDVIRAKRQVS